MSWFTSHVLASFGLARRLQELGFEVEYWGHPRIGPIASKHGFTFHALDDIWQYELFPPTGVFGPFLRPLAYLGNLKIRRSRRRSLIDSVSRFEQSLERNVARRVPAFAVLHPFVASYCPLLCKRGIHCVVLNDKPLPVPDELVPPPRSALIPRRTAVCKAQVKVLWLALQAVNQLQRLGKACYSMMGMYTSEDVLREVERRTGISAQGERTRRWLDYDLCFKNIDEWVLSIPQADFPRARRLPENIRYVGPCVDVQRVQVGAEIARVADARYLVLVSMGITLPNWNADLYLLRKLVDAFEGIPDIQVVIATGNEAACRALGNVPVNIAVYAFVDQLSALDAADLVITHGGANTVRECIVTNTPMLVFPRGHDQPGNAARITYHGIGLCGSRWLETPASIRRKALRILEDSGFSERLQALNAAVRESEGSLIQSAVEALVGKGACISVDTPHRCCTGQ